MQKRDLDRVKASNALNVLVNNVEKIRTVSDWAAAVCLSPEWLRKKMNLVYKKNPSRIIREVRYKVIISLIIEKGYDTSSIEVAIDSGVGQTSDSLYKFLKRYYGATFTELKVDVLKSINSDPQFRCLKLMDHTDYGDIYTEIDDNIYLPK